MGKKNKETRTRNMVFRVSPDEYQALQDSFKATTHRVFSDYLRDMLFKRPMTKWSRNQSLDEFLPIAIALKNELNTIGKNFNQAVKKLQSLPDQGQSGNLEFYDAAQFSLLQKIEEIKVTLVKMYQLWSAK